MLKAHISHARTFPAIIWYYVESTHITCWTIPSHYMILCWKHTYHMLEHSQPLYDTMLKAHISHAGTFPAIIWYNVESTHIARRNIPSHYMIPCWKHTYHICMLKAHISHAGPFPSIIWYNVESTHITCWTIPSHYMIQCWKHTYHMLDHSQPLYDTMLKAHISHAGPFPAIIGYNVESTHITRGTIPSHYRIQCWKHTCHTRERSQSLYDTMLKAYISHAGPFPAILHACHKHAMLITWYQSSGHSMSNFGDYLAAVWQLLKVRYVSSSLTFGRDWTAVPQYIDDTQLLLYINFL